MPGKLHVRRTLLIGIGTTGKEVAEGLAEHLTWRFGDYRRAAWVRLLVLETQQTPSFLGDRLIWAGMTGGDYQAYINQPQTTGHEFGFYEWQDGPTLSAINNPAAGAGNCRMLGRLCLFHGPTYEALRMRAVQDVQHLKLLTAQKVADALGDTSLSVELDRETVVYVVGTLCGGTCSGAAADLGYLLHTWLDGEVNRQAIFTLPPPGLVRPEAPRYKKNAWYALQELNHYMLDENPWSQLLPGFPAPTRIKGPPYDILRIVMPRGPHGTDVKQLNTMIAQYLAAAVGPAGHEIAANDVNALGKMASTERIGFMRPLLSTMAVAALEYPGEHILRAATSRLLAGALSRWCKHSVPDGAYETAMAGLLPDSLDAFVDRLTAGADAWAVSALVASVRPNARGQAPAVEDVRKSLRGVAVRLEAVDLPSGEAAGDAPASLVQVMLQNHQELLRRASADVGNFVAGRLFELDGGPGFVRETLRRLLARLDGWLVEAQAFAPEASQTAQSLREVMAGELEKADRAGGGWWPFGKAARLRAAWASTESPMEAFARAEMRKQALARLQHRDLIRSLAEQYRRATAVALQRLERLGDGFAQAAAELDKTWRDMAASSPEVNGRAYFDAEPPAPRGTVTEEYFNLLRQRKWPGEPPAGWDDAGKETAAMREVVHALSPLASDLGREDGSSTFDSRPGVQTARDMIPPEVLAGAEAVARQVFEPLRRQVHIADRASENDVAAVIQVSEPALQVNEAQVSHQLAGVRGVIPTAQNLAFTDLPDGGAMSPALQRMADRVTNGMQLTRGSIVDSDDPFRLLLIREKHGFTLGQLPGVVQASTADLTSLQSAEHCRDFHFWHTRRDVTWMDPLVPPQKVEAAEEAWLLAVLLGRPADGVLSWTPAATGDIEPAGWYQVANGQFLVRYMPGPDVMQAEEQLPVSFPDAVGLLLTPHYSVLLRTLSTRFTTYASKCGDAAVVRVVHKGLASLQVFGLGNLEPRRADAIVRRAYRRSDGLTRAYFDYTTQELTQQTEPFAHLFHRQGEPLPGGVGAFPEDAYYCPVCCLPLGVAVGALLAQRFYCPRCNSGERYWP